MPDSALNAALLLLQKLPAALQRNDRVRLREIVGELIRLRAPMGEQWQALARIAANIGELTMSRHALALFVEASGNGPAARYRQAAILTESGAWEDAFDILDRLPDDVPDAASNAYSRGASLLMLGRIGEARDQFERVIRIKPQSAQAWLGLAMATEPPDAPGLARRLVAAEPQIAYLPAADRAPFYYALGQVHAACNEYALAFAAFAQGAQYREQVTPYDQEADRRDAEESVRGYTQQSIASLGGAKKERCDRAIFVTGLPRSGTTLVEHIITSHSRVAGGGEIARVDLLEREIGGRSFGDVQRYCALHDVDDLVQLWNHWLHERFPEPGRIADKTLSNTRALGLLATLLPSAPLIWVTRNSLDRAWSCFRTLFTGQHEWSYNLADIAFHFRLEDNVLSVWRDVLGSRLLVVPYEALVAESRDWTKRILAHCGLAEEPAVFSPESNSRAVTTASTVQVRRPVNPSSIGSSAPYKEFLAPFLRAEAA